MKIPRYRVFYVIIDQLAGHWEDSVRIEGTDLPPVNVKGYHEKGLIPNISYLINNGLWVKRTWNRGICDTAHGMKYLSTGTYDMNANIGLFEYLYSLKIKTSVFTTQPWGSKGYFYIPGNLISLPGYYRPYMDDYLIWKLFVEPYLDLQKDWGAVHFYLPINDLISFCPSYQKFNPHPRSSKHAYMLYLDKLIGEIIEFLKVKGYWNDTIIVIASDHGYHLGCSVARERGAKSVNWCADHPEPYDCYIWDFDNDRNTEKYSGGPRRTTFIVSGGALDDEYKGKVIEEAEIIDVVPTIAKLLGIDYCNIYKCEGKSIL